MAENDGGVVFINCIGSDINLFKKGCSDTTFEHETCLLFDEPEYHLDEYSDLNTTWKFHCHITKRYLLGNGKRTFHFQEYKCPKIKVKITSPLYTLKELCTYTIAVRLMANDSITAIDDFEIPNRLKADIKNTANDLTEILEAENEELVDWTQYNEEFL